MIVEIERLPLQEGILLSHGLREWAEGLFHGKDGVARFSSSKVEPVLSVKFNGRSKRCSSCKRTFHVNGFPRILPAVQT